MGHRFHALGQGESAEGDLERPDRYRFFERFPEGVAIPRGAGLSLAGAGFGEGVRAIDMRRFDRLLAFDADGGRLTVEAGASLGQVFDFLAPRGWQMPVQPGYPDITVGGCVAGHVHGKNPRVHGCFGRWVERLHLYHPRHGVLDLSPDRGAELFDLTLGGFGLTGVILDVTLRLIPLPPGTIRIHPRKVGSLEEAAEQLAQADATANQVYAWADLAGRRRRGPGIVFVGRHVAGDSGAGRLGRYRPLDPARRGWPLTVMRGAGVRLVNLEQWRRWAGAREVSVIDATFPFAATPVFFDLFGRAGMIEHQTLVPWESVPAYFAGLRAAIDRHRATPGLVVMKPFAGRPHLLRFEGEGLSLAVEVTADSAGRALLADLDRLDCETGARPNILKDARLPSAAVAATYGPARDEMRARLERFDPDRTFQSALSRRIGL